MKLDKIPSFKEVQKVRRNSMNAMQIMEGEYIILWTRQVKVKKELMDSWKQLFDKTDLCKKYTEGAVWQLKKEWVIEKYIL